MQNDPFYPRLTKAECEFWFDSGAHWQEQTERLIETRLSQVFADVCDTAEPFVWFEPNYLAVLSEPVGGASAHREVETHAARIRCALAAYQNAAQPRRVATLFLRYQFEFPSDILRNGPRKMVWKTPSELITLERDDAEARQTCLALRCLIAHPPARCLTRSGRWLKRIHQKMEGAFHELRQCASLVQS